MVTTARTWLSSVRGTLLRHQPFFLLLSAFIVFRLLSIIFLKFGGYVLESGADEDFLFRFGQLSDGGLIPFVDFWAEYPPIAPWLVALARKISLMVPVWHFPILGFNIIFRSLLLLFDIGNLTLVYLLAIRLTGSREQGLTVTSLWTLLFVPLMTLLGWFEPLVLFFLLLALYGSLCRRPTMAGLGIGLGFMAKVFPAVLFPIGLLVMETRKQRRQYVIVSAVSALLVAIPPLLRTPDYILAWLNGMLERSSWETVWALLDGYTGFGQVAPLFARNDPSAASIEMFPSTLPWLAISAMFATIYFFWLSREIDWKDDRIVVRAALFSIVLFMLYSKGFSPQWLTFISTLALLAFPVRRGLAYALLIDFYFVAEFPTAFVIFTNQTWFVSAVIVMRTLVMVLIALDSIAHMWPSVQLWQPLRRYAVNIAWGFSIITVFIVARPAWDAYAATRLAADPLASIIEDIRDANASLILTQSQTLERMAPHLQHSAIHFLPNGLGHPWTAIDSWMDEATASLSDVWLVFDGETNEAHGQLHGEVRTWLDANSCIVQEQWLDNQWVGHYVTEPRGLERVLTANLNDGILLTAARLPEVQLAAGDAFCLNLIWQADEQPSADYTIFAHLLTTDGQLVAQSDQRPVNPTSQWTTSERELAELGIVLPNSLPAGDYHLVAGLYGVDGTRLLLEDGSDVIKLMTIEVGS